MVKKLSGYYVWNAEKIGYFKVLITLEIKLAKQKRKLKHWYFQTWQNQLVYSHGDLKKDFAEYYKLCFTNKLLTNNKPEKLRVGRG